MIVAMSVIGPASGRLESVVSSEAIETELVTSTL